MKKLAQILNLLMYAVIAAALAFVIYELFFVGEQEVFLEEEKFMEEFSIVYPQEPISLEPTLTTPSTRQILINVYEPLLRFDADLNPEPALALYWGLIDDYTWEFKLRPDVVFHDGSLFDVEDVKFSIERAQSHELSQVADFLTSIDEFEVVDDLTFRVRTLEPDPLLLQRISTVLVVPSAGVKELPIGTGPYQFSGEMLEANDNYWGDAPQFAKVELLYEPDKNLRTAMLVNGDADFLAFVPFDGVEFVEDQGFDVVFVPTLEVQFLIFNHESEVFEDSRARQAVNLALDRLELVEELGGQAKAVNQFVSGGVFGSNPGIDANVYDFEKAVGIVQDLELEGSTLQIHLLQGLEVLGEYLRINFSELGMKPVISYVDFDGLMESMDAGKADLYFLAFKADLGDAMDFFDQIVVSDGEFNFFAYNNELVDQLIEAASTEMNIARRRDLLQSAMEVVVNEDILGVPLFEYEIAYGFNEKIQYLPRIDGLIYFDDLIIK